MEEFERCMKAPIEIPNGSSVTCNDGTGMVYRIENGTLRYYPTAAMMELAFQPTEMEDQYRVPDAASAVQVVPSS